MRESDPQQDLDTTQPSCATRSRLAALTAEVALRDRELTVLREAIDAERAQARAARSLAEENLKEAEHAAHVQQRLEEAAAEIRGAYSDLRMQHDGLAVELETARTQAIERAERAEVACAAAQLSWRQAEEERDSAVQSAAEAERTLQAAEARWRGELQRVAAQLLATRQRAEQERHEAASAAAEALTALAAAEYRRRTRYEHTIGELKVAHAAALEQAVRAEAERAADAVLCQRLQREHDEIAAKGADAEKVIARAEDRIRTLLEDDAAHRAEADALRAMLAARERDVETAQRAEQSVLKVLTGVRAILAEQEGELESARARTVELEARLAATESDHKETLAAVDGLAAERNAARAELQAEQERSRAGEESCAALRAKLALCETQLAEQRDAQAAAEEAAAQWTERYRAYAEGQTRELAAARVELAAAVSERAALSERLQRAQEACAVAEQHAAALQSAHAADAREVAEARATIGALGAKLDGAQSAAAAAAAAHSAAAEGWAARVAATERAHEAAKASIEELAAERDVAWKELEAEQDQLREAEETCAALRATLAMREADLAEQRDTCATERRSRTEAEDALAQLAERYRAFSDGQARELDAARVELAAAVSERAALSERLQQLEAGCATAEQRLVALQAARAAESQEAQAAAAALSAELEAARRAHAEAEADAAERLRAAGDGQARELEAARGELAAAVSERAALSERLQQLEGACAAAEQHAAALQATHTAESQQAQAATAALSAELEAAQRARAEAEADAAGWAERHRAAADGQARELEAARGELAAAVSERAALSERLQQLEGACAAAEQHAAALQATHAAESQQAQAATAALSAELEAAQRARAEAEADAAGWAERHRAAADGQARELEAARGELAAAVSERAALSERLQQLEGACAAAEQHAAALQATHAAESQQAQAATAALSAELEAAQRARAEAEADAAGWAERHRAAADGQTRELEAARGELATTLAQLDDLRQQLAVRDRALQALEARRAQWEQERETRELALCEAARRADSHAGALRDELAARTRERDDVQVVLDATRTDLQNVVTESVALRGEMQVLREQLSGVDELTAVRSRCEAAEAAHVAAESEGKRLREIINGNVTENDRLSAQITLLEQRELAANATETRFSDQLRECADQNRGAQLDVQRLQAVVNQLEGALASTREALDACRAESQHSASRVAVAEREEPQRLTDEVSQLPMRIEVLECRQPGAMQSDSEIARLGALENQRLLEQLNALERACEPGVEGLSSFRRQRDWFEQRRGAADANDAQRFATESPRRADTKAVSAAGEGAASARREPTPPSQPARGARGSAAEPPAAAIVLEPGQELTVVHVEDHVPLRDAVRAAVERCPCTGYAALHEISAGAEGRTHLLAVNLLLGDTDPFSTICDPRWRQREARAFTYLAADGRGIVAGLTDFIPYPLDPNDCVTRLLERPAGTRRLLMVSDKIDAMNEIRAVLNRFDCSTSLALDDRQGFSLARMVKPDAILIDLALPRAGGVRLMNRLRSDRSTAGIAMILALTEPFEPGRFKAEAGRVLGDCRFSDEELSGALVAVLNEVQTAEPQRKSA